LGVIPEKLVPQSAKVAVPLDTTTEKSCKAVAAPKPQKNQGERSEDVKTVLAAVYVAHITFISSC
jgi:hypothetical protein